MKKTFRKRKRRTYSYRPKKSLLLSTISIKNVPKRKKKIILKTLFSRFAVFSTLFVISLLILLIVYYRTPTILSPIPIAFSQMLSGYIDKNPDLITSKVTSELNKHHIIYTSVIVNGSDIHIQLDDTTAV